MAQKSKWGKKDRTPEKSNLTAKPGLRSKIGQGGGLKKKKNLHRPESQGGIKLKYLGKGELTSKKTGDEKSPPTGEGEEQAANKRTNLRLKEKGQPIRLRLKTQGHVEGREAPGKL